MRLADLNGMSVAVWGTGPEGRAAVTAVAPHQPARLLAVDDSANFRSVSWDGAVAELAPLAGGDHAFGALVAADVVVRSPDVPQTHPWMAELRSRGVMITGGSALWMADHAARTVGVTGSKGKSTTAALISRLLAAVGRPNVFGGDVGGPLLELPASDLYVLELSSLQCADLTDSPRVTVVTSLFPEHLGTHGGETEYYRDQLNLLTYGPELIVVNGCDERLSAQLTNARDASGWAPVAVGGEDSRFRIDPDDQVYASDTRLFPRSTLKPHGQHNGINLCIALAVLDGMGIDVVDVRGVLEKAVASFPDSAEAARDSAGLA